MEQGTMARPSAAPRGMQVFLLIWFGQVISLLGSGLTGFAMGVWVFQRTGSATQFTLIAFFGSIPFVLFSPIAGVLVDRWDRRKALIVSQIGASVTPLTLLLLIATGNFSVWPIYLIVAISSAFRAFLIPAFAASSTLLVPKEQYARASGMVQAAFGIQLLLGPLMAGVLLGMIGLGGIFLIDLVTFIFAIVTLLLVRIPRPEVSAEGLAARGTMRGEAAYGWRFILARPGLLGLLIFFAISNFLMGTLIVLATPLILSFSGPTELGTIMSVSGVGTLVGSVLISIWGGPRHRIQGVLVPMLLSGVWMMLGGLAPSLVLIGVGAFLLAFGLPIVGGCSQAIWQSKVPPDIQGRVFAIRAMIASAAMPIAYLLSGPLADFVFNPLLVPGGALADSVGRVIGVGPGRGIGLLFIVLGALTIVATIGGYMYPRLRRVEQELPDVIPDTPPADAGSAAPGPIEPQPKLEHI
jgi:DHA3 family macrolide efflux protein-like MFS transporter